MSCNFHPKLYLLNCLNMKVKCSWEITRDLDSWIVGDHFVMKRLDGFGIGLHPSNLQRKIDTHVTTLEPRSSSVRFCFYLPYTFLNLWHCTWILRPFRQARMNFLIYPQIGVVRLLQNLKIRLQIVKLIHGICWNWHKTSRVWRSQFSTQLPGDGIDF